MDEAHCVTLWGNTFRSSYKQLNRLHIYFSTKAKWIQWYLTSATLNLRAVSNVLKLLEMPPFLLQTPTPPDATRLIQRSNERPNHHYAVKQMKSSASSFRDLAFLVPGGPSATNPQTIVYVNSRSEAEACVKYLRSRESSDITQSIIYVHSGMSELHRVEAVQGFKEGKITVIVATEALGLVRCRMIHCHANF